MEDADKTLAQQGLEIDLQDSKMRPALSLPALNEYGDTISEHDPTSPPEDLHLEQIKVLRQVEAMEEENYRLAEAHLPPRSPVPQEAKPSLVSDDDAHALVSRMFQHLCSTHARIQQQENFTKLEVFGWNDLRCDVGEYVDFAVTKTFRNESAAARCMQTWGFFGDLKMSQKLVPPMNGAGPLFPQIIDEKTVIIHGAGHDALVTHSGADLLIARAESNGKWMLIMGYFDADKIEDHLAAPTPIDECFSWYFEDLPEDLTTGEDARTLVQVGGSLRNTSEMMVRILVSEQVFVMIRWEMLALHHLRLEGDLDEEEASP